MKRLIEKHGSFCRVAKIRNGVWSIAPASCSLSTVACLRRLPPIGTSNRLVRGFLGEWQLSGLVSAQTGRPLTVLSGVNNSGTGIGQDRANIVGNAVLDAVLEPGFLAHVEAMSLRFKQELARIKDEFPAVVEEVRASGLLTGIKVKPPYAEVVHACAAQKLLNVGAGDNVVRLLPPLNVTEAEIGEATKRLAAALRTFSNPAA